MKRRSFLTLLGGAAAAWPMAARAQQDGRVRRIGVLMAAKDDDQEYQGYLTVLGEGLLKLGWVEGKNLKIDYRWGAEDPLRAQQLAQELIALRPDLVVTQSTPTSLAMMRETRTIPIIFATMVDPVGGGLVASLPRPGGNVTGFLTLEGSVAGKWLELLKEIAPRINRVAFLFNPTSAPYSDYYLSPFRVAATKFSVEAIAAPAQDPSELESVIATQANVPNSGLIVMPNAFLNTHRAKIISLAAQYQLPVVYPFRFFVEAGGLISYGDNLSDHYPLVATYVDRVLRGAKPSDLPVQVPVKYETVLNLKTAKALGLTVPDLLLVRADEVIE